MLRAVARTAARSDPLVSPSRRFLLTAFPATRRTAVVAMVGPSRIGAAVSSPGGLSTAARRARPARCDAVFSFQYPLWRARLGLSSIGRHWATKHAKTACGSLGWQLLLRLWGCNVFIGGKVLDRPPLPTRGRFVDV